MSAIPFRVLPTANCMGIKEWVSSGGVKCPIRDFEVAKLEKEKPANRLLCICRIRSGREIYRCSQQLRPAASCSALWTKRIGQTMYSQPFHLTDKRGERQSQKLCGGTFVPICYLQDIADMVLYRHIKPHVFSQWRS